MKPDETWVEIKKEYPKESGPVQWGHFGVDGEPILTTCPSCRKSNLATAASTGRCYYCRFDINEYFKGKK